ncbi:1,3-beta-glucanosyltransferase gas1, partial [Sticta canariensis]|nr:1,3-beta-glucanosyltransferase gas1 [Sticta canariensis]
HIDGVISGTVAQSLRDNTNPEANALTDPLTDNHDCSQPVLYLKNLHTNVIRTYYIDTSRDHSNCMALFAQAGIYVMVDLMTPGYVIDLLNPIWNDVLYNQYTSVIDTMHNYTNLPGFTLGDDVISGISQKHSGPYLKAAVRDMKAYIRQKSYRPIPVGSVNSVNGQDNNFTFSDYLNCGDKSEDNIDFWGANIRDWCESSYNGRTSNYTYSSYAIATSALSAYPLPAFLAAYGCADPSYLDFSDIDVIYGQLMSPVWSGGFFHQYFSRPDTSDGFVDPAGELTANYWNVSRHLAAVSPSSINPEKYIPTNTAAPCPAGAALSLPPNPIAVSLTASSPRTSAFFITPTSSITPTPKASNNALSTGEKVGIGIGLALLVLALGTYFIQRRATERKKIERGPWTKTELAADDVDREARGYGPHMAASTQRAEVDGSGVIREVQADRNEILRRPVTGQPYLSFGTSQ